MAFKPMGSNKTGGNTTNFEPRNFPVPKAGPRKARISLIVDLGVQEREDFEDPKTKELKPQKPCQQVAVFADLVSDTVDYGGDIGKQHYRMLLNNTFAGVLKGVNFTAVPPKDANGAILEGKPWTLHPANLLTKVAKAVNKPDVITSMDIEQLLNEPFMCDVEVNEKDSGKADKDGKPIIYRNVNFKGASKVPMVETGEEDDDGNPIEVAATIAALKQPARCVTFDNATADDIQFIRGNILKVIKLATNYSGSKMEAAVKEFEAAKGDAPVEEAPAKKEEAKKPVAKAGKPAKAAPPEDDEMDPEEGSPF